jgi:ribosomal protein S18 acetylase RimI-like enzyme
MSLVFRETRPADAHYLIDIDIKCFEHAWTPEEWRETSETSLGAVATWHGVPIGMSISRRSLEGDVEVVKVGVKPPYRNNGIGRHLLQNCILHARDIMATRLFTIVPESAIAPGQPQDLSTWLSKLGFRAEKPLLRNHFYSYGQSEDGVTFSMPVSLT